MKKFTILIYLIGALFFSNVLNAQPGCGDTNNGLLTITDSWQSVAGDAGIIPYWSFEATAGTKYSFSSCLCAEDTYLRIYDDSFLQVASNDDNGPYCSGTRSSIDWTCTLSGTYYVSISNYFCDPFENPWTLEYKFEIPPPPPENDECEDAEAIGEVADFPFNTELATTSGVGTHSIGKDIWYVFTADGDGTIDVGLCGSSFDTKLAVWEECGINEIAYNDDGCYSKALQSNVSDVNVLDGEDYYIQVGGYSTASGDGLLTIEFTPAPTIGYLSGLVTDDNTNLPIEGATVYASDGDDTFSGTTDEFGEYELELPVGEYDTYAVAPGYYPSEPQDVIVTIIPGEYSFQDYSLLPVPGSTCELALVIDEFPFEDLGQTNCGLGDFYDETLCLGNYDNGEDILYTFEITEMMALNFTLDPKGTSWAGFGIFEGCPDLDICVAAATNSFNSTPFSLQNVVFEPGTYFLMIDTYSSPDCIPDFDLFIEESVPGFINGFVTDIDTDEPIEGVEVVADPGGFNAFTDENGEYFIEAYEGTYDVTFLKPEYYQLTVSDTNIVAGDITIVDAALEIIPLPECAEVVYPAEDQMAVFPVGMTFEWENGSEVPVDGYKISIYDFFYNEWVLQGFDVGNQTTFTTDLGWNRNYGWQIQPYNVAGVNDNCLPNFFTTSNKGIIEGMVSDIDSGLPLEGVEIIVESISPNPGTVWNLTSDADGSWGLSWEDGLEEGTYDIFFQKYGYNALLIEGFEVQANNPTMSDEQMTPVTPFPLPFVETWDNGNAQLWGAQVANWIITSGNGNPAPTLAFSYSPVISEAYSEYINSYYLDGMNADKIYAQIDMSLNYWDMSTIESFSFVVYDGTEWHVLQTWDNSVGGDIPWDTYTYDISEFAVGNFFLVGFLAEGTDTFSFDYWYADNILVTESILDVAPDEVADVMFADGTTNHTVTLTNTGNAALTWNLDELGLPLWITADLATGELEPGASQDVVLTLDGAIAGAGMHNAEVLFTAMDGFLEATVDVNLEVYEESGQEIMIPGPGEWGYISSYVNLDSKMDLDEALAAIKDELVIMIGASGIYWPGFEINTIGEYNTYEGYKMKMDGIGALAFLGDMVEDQSVTFPAGTFIIPILSDEPVDVMEMLDEEAVEFAFGMDGSIYWPEGPIYTLETFYPGYGYLVKFNAETTLDFGMAPPKNAQPNNPPAFENITNWNDVYKTGDFHMVGISSEATTDLETGDMIGIFNTAGLCTGMINYTGNGEMLAIPVFADDVTTDELDGMNEYEPLLVKIFRDGEAIEANAVYSVEMPNHDGLFESNGLSMITSLKAGATSIGDEAVRSISVYPNPSDGIFNINGIGTAIELQVTNSHGQVIATDKVNDDYMLDISDHPAGVYFIRMVGEKGIKLVKVIKQ